jgi:hypothetical protein
MNMFSNRQLDAVFASHVLEHLPIDYLDQSLQEIARVGKCAIIYLPVHGHLGLLRFISGLRGIDLCFTYEIFNYFERPDGKTAKYMAGQHYWEIGLRGFRVKDLLKRFSKHFEVLTHYRNTDFLMSYNFVLRAF